MKTSRSSSALQTTADGMPDAASLAALRAWNEGLTAREAVARYLGHVKADRQSSRGMLGAIRRQLMRFATQRHRSDLAAVFDYPAEERSKRARAVAQAIEALPFLSVPEPQIGDGTRNDLTHALYGYCMSMASRRLPT